MLICSQELKAVNNMNEYAGECFRKMQEIAEENNEMSEEKKQQYLQRIMQKIKNGEKLTGEELSFVQRNYPELYPKIMRIQSQRQQLENRLRQAKSKEEAARIYNEVMSSIPKDDPDKEALQSAYSKAFEEFKKTGEYKALPEKEEDARKQSAFSVYGEMDEVEKEKRLLIQPEFDVVG